MSVIDFQSEHEKRHGPDAEHVYIDPATGKKWFKFAVDYKDGGREFSFHIWAYDIEDAKRRLQLIRDNATICGQLFHTIEA